MALIIRIDADRPYGRRPLLRHVLGTLSSAAYFPRIEALGCLRQLSAYAEGPASWERLGGARIVKAVGAVSNHGSGEYIE